MQSANEIVLLAQEEDGPKSGQKSRAIGTSYGILSYPAKKDKFYIYNDSDLDEKYKGVVDCSNPVSLRKQRKRPAELPAFYTVFDQERGAEQCESMKKVKQFESESPSPSFNFADYSFGILTRNSERLALDFIA